MDQTKMVLELLAVTVVMASAAVGASYPTAALPDDGGMPHLTARALDAGDALPDLSLASRELGDGGY